MIFYPIFKLGIYDDDPEIITLERREFGKFLGYDFLKVVKYKSHLLLKTHRSKCNQKLEMV